jgi:hypothetical protein
VFQKFFEDRPHNLLAAVGTLRQFDILYSMAQTQRLYGCNLAGPEAGQQSPYYGANLLNSELA